MLPLRQISTLLLVAPDQLRSTLCLPFILKPLADKLIAAAASVVAEAVFE